MKHVQRLILTTLIALTLFTSAASAHTFKAVSKGWLPEEESDYNARWVEFWVNDSRILFAKGGSYRRGLNVATINYETGQRETIRTFDTWANPRLVPYLANYIRALPDDKVILMAIKGEGVTNWNEDLYAALEDLGSEKCRLIRFRESWTLVLRKGHPEFGVYEDVGIGEKIASTVQPEQVPVKILSPQNGTAVAGKRNEG